MLRTARQLAAIALVAVVLTACGNGDPSSPIDSASPSATRATPTSTVDPESEEPSPTEAGTVITLTVTGGDVSGADARVAVPLGDTVTIHVTADVDDEIHVHGYDLHQAVVAGEQATLTFTADVSGVFEVELEDAGLPLVSLEVQ